MPAPLPSREPTFPGVPGVGETFAGKYRIERVIGVGGMGVVVAAQHVQLGQRVAIKFLNADAAGDAEAVGRFLREARAAASIDNEHIARVLDVGETPGGAPFMVMEHLSGMDLAAMLHAHGPRPVNEAIDYVLQAAEAIAQAHAVGVVHRDLKPSNLFLVRRPDGIPLVKVLDFGISKITSLDADPQLTATQASYGTPMYMSPEQVRSMKTVDRRTDVWALGVILHELVSGRLPFAGETLTALSASIASDAPVPLRAHVPSAPAALEEAILRCLEKTPSRRFPGVAELATALAPLAHESSRGYVERIQRISSGAFAPSPSEPSALAHDPTQLTASAWGRTRSLGRGGRALLFVSAAAIAVGLVALVAFSVGKRGEAAPGASVADVGSQAASASAPLPTASDAPPAALVSASARPRATTPPPTKRPPPRDNVDALKDRR